MDWRQINTNIADSYYVTAADEAIINYRQKNYVPNTLHFYRRNQSTISLGRSRKIQHDIHLDTCHKHDITILRRITGGGTIYTDPGCLIYSLIFNPQDTPITSKQDAFNQICSAVINALSSHGISATYKPPNDILLNGKKISGAGIIKKNPIILIHGTLLHSTNLIIMQQLLKKQENNTKVTSLKQEINNPPKIQTLQQSIAHQIAQLFQISFLTSELTSEEKTMIAQLIHTRYSKDSWTFKR
jgi:lipoate-protein ligase A